MSVPWYLMAKGKGGGGYKTASGPIVSVNDALAAPLRSLLVNIEPVQDLHGYDNPWPAGGGKNLFNPAEAVDGVYINNDTGAAGEQTGSAATGFIPVTAGLPYRMSPTLTAGNWGAFYDANKVFISGFSGYGFSKTAPTGAAYLRCTINRNNTNPNWATNFQVEQNTEATAWTPYSNICPISGWSAVNVWLKPTYDPTENPTATLQLGDTYYGGTLDVKTGVLTVTHAEVDLGSLTWTHYGSGETAFFYSDSNIGVKPSTTNAISSMFRFGSITTTNTNNNAFSITENPYVRIRCLDYSDATAFKTAVTGQTLVYELATPITIPLTPQEISTLQGQNNVWADTGDVTVEYLSSGGTDPDLMKLAVAFMGRK